MALVTTHCQGAAQGATRTMEDPGGGALHFQPMALLWDSKVWEDVCSAGIVGREASWGGLLSPECESVGEAHLMNTL